MKRQPNPDADRVSWRVMVRDWIHEKPKRLLASHMAILGVLLWIAVFVVGIIAIWTPPEPLGNRIGNTAALLAIPAAGFTVGGFVWRSC